MALLGVKDNTSTATIVSYPTLGIGPYLLYREKFIIQFKTTENNDRSPYLFSRK